MEFCDFCLKNLHVMQNCKNCELEFEGKYCPNCGQKAKTKRITTKQVVEDLRTTFFHYDSGFFYTVKEMMTRPGHTVREYLEGKRVAHVKPIKFLIWATALNFLLFTLLGLDKEMARTFTEKNMATDGSARIMEWIFQHPAIIMMLMMPCITLFTFWFYRRNGGFNFAENFVLNSYLMGAANMFGLVLNPLFKVFGNSDMIFNLKITTNFLVYFLFFGWGYVQFFQPRNRWLGWLKAVLATVMGYVLMILIATIVSTILVLLLVAFSKDTLHEWFGKPIRQSPAIDSLK